MNSTMHGIVASGNSPPWLPRDVAEGRHFAWWAELMFLLMALVWFIISIVSMTVYIVGGSVGNLALGLLGLFAMVICFLSSLFLKKTVIDAIDQGRFHDAKNDTIIWLVVGFFAFGIPTILLILTYVKLGDALVAQAPAGYAPYAPGTVTAQAPGQAYVPPPAPVQPAPVQQAPAQAQQQYHAHTTPMVRCKNCNVQFPMFMHTCPNCGSPKE
jgi:hypothetical protein